MKNLGSSGNEKLIKMSGINESFWDLDKTCPAYMFCLTHKRRMAYNDGTKGWYPITKLLPYSYISTICVVIVHKCKFLQSSSTLMLLWSILFLEKTFHSNITISKIISIKLIWCLLWHQRCSKKSMCVSDLRLNLSADSLLTLQL